MQRIKTVYVLSAITFARTDLFLQCIHMNFCVKQQIMEILLVPIILVAACLEYNFQFWATSLPGEKKKTNWRQLKEQLK